MASSSLSSFGALVPSGFSATSSFPASAAVSNSIASGNTIGNTGFTAAAFTGSPLTAAGNVNTDVNSFYSASGEVPAFANAASAFGGGSSQASGVWNFIVAPEEVSWDLQVATQRVDIFGTNSPPVTVGTKGMRNLSIGNALIEGFTRARTVEGRVIALENLTKFTLNSQGGFVNVPVYQVFANDKKYGDGNGVEGGYFVISDIRVKETMRDYTGKSTRAYADISMVQVPKYQVNTGRDQASKALSGVNATGLQGGPNAAAKSAASAATQGVGTTQPAAGQGTPPPKPPVVSQAFAQPTVA